MSANPDAGLPSRGPVLLGVAWPLTIVSTIFVLMRWYCRLVYQSRYWWDDMWMTVSVALSWVMTILWTVYSDLGGTSYTPIAPDTAITVNKINWVSQSICILALMAGKLAVAALILRLQAPNKIRTIIIWTMCVILVIWDCIAFIFVYVQCRPIASLFDPTSPGECWDPWIVVNDAIGVSAYMAFMDLALAIIPVQMIWGLQMPMRRKLGICVLLSTGLFAFVMAVIKIVMLPEDLDRTSDFVRTTVLLFVWNSCEVNSVIIAGCIPTVMPLFEAIRGRDPNPNGRPGRKRRLLFNKNVSLGSGRHTAPQQSFHMSSKAPLASRASSDEQQWGNDTHVAATPHGAGAGNTSRPDLEAGRIQVRRDIDISSPEKGDRW